MPDNEEYWSTNDYSLEICPLTHQSITNGFCLYADCNSVTGEALGFLYGRPYRCALEKENIEKWHTDHLKEAERRVKIENSLKVAQQLNLNDFFSYCDQLAEKMFADRQEYNRTMTIMPYLEAGERFLIYVFRSEAVVRITSVKNLCSFVASIYNDLCITEENLAISYYPVKESMSEAIVVRQYLQHGFDVRGVLHATNPIYINKSQLKALADKVYGIGWRRLKVLLKNNFDLTEIENYDDTIYIKQEIDRILRLKGGDK